MSGRWLTAWTALVGALLWHGLALAQSLDVTTPNEAAPFGPPVHDDRIYAHALLDEFEGRFGAGDTPFRWDGEAWIGTDANRLWLKSEGFALGGEVRDGDQELLYDRPLSTYFDMQAGARYDLDSLARRGWAALGIEGLAPYFFELSATLYASDASHFAARVRTSYDELLTQRLILQPLIELDAYTRADAARQLAAGLSDLDVGVRLRYEINRKFAPYLGVIYQRTRGTGPRTDPLDTSPGGAWRWVGGVRAWL